MTSHWQLPSMHPLARPQPSEGGGHANQVVHVFGGRLHEQRSIFQPEAHLSELFQQHTAWFPAHSAGRTTAIPSAPRAPWRRAVLTETGHSCHRPPSARCQKEEGLIVHIRTLTQKRGCAYSSMYRYTQQINVEQFCIICSAHLTLPQRIVTEECIGGRIICIRLHLLWVVVVCRKHLCSGLRPKRGTEEGGSEYH